GIFEKRNREPWVRRLRKMLFQKQLKWYFKQYFYSSFYFLLFGTFYPHGSCRMARNCTGVSDSSVK
ncbi:MAG: hypothetical protein ACLS9X_08000, partial [Faecalibacterium sp.]